MRTDENWSASQWNRLCRTLQGRLKLLQHKVVAAEKAAPLEASRRGKVFDISQEEDTHTQTLSQESPNR